MVWDAALTEIEHQAEHWASLPHSIEGHFVADSLREAVRIAREGGLKCKHRSNPS